VLTGFDTEGDAAGQQVAAVMRETSASSP
jgi:hypothetical protein